MLISSTSRPCSTDTSCSRTRVCRLSLAASADCRMSSCFILQCGRGVGHEVEAEGLWPQRSLRTRGVPPRHLPY